MVAVGEVIVVITITTQQEVIAILWGALMIMANMSFTLREVRVANIPLQVLRSLNHCLSVISNAMLIGLKQL